MVIIWMEIIIYEVKVLKKSTVILQMPFVRINMEQNSFCFPSPLRRNLEMVKICWHNKL